MARLAHRLALVAALFGAPMRHAEAASDLGRSLDEMTEFVVIEPVDGGVGDDAGDALGPARPSGVADTPTGSEPCNAAIVALTGNMAGGRVTRWEARPPTWSLAPDGSRRQAVLQVHRF